MADSNVLKEFLVALGFTVDEKKLKRFTAGIDNASKMVGKFALGLEAMATAAEVAVVKVSTQFENLYYASQRLGDTVEDIRGFSFAMGQVGSTGKAGLQAMENIAEFLRSNPGGNRLFQAWGIDLKYVNGQAQVTSQTMEQLGATFRKMPYFQAKQYAAVLGIDPNTLQAMLRGTSEAQGKASEIFKRMGVDQDKAALASKNLMNDFREFLLVLTVGLDKVILRIQPAFTAIVRGLEALDKATGGWSTALIVLVGLLAPLLAILDPILIVILAIGLALTQVDWSKWTIELGDVGDGVNDLISALRDLGKALGPVAGWFSDAFGSKTDTLVSKFLTGTAAGLHQVADGIRLVGDLLTGHWKSAWADAGKIAYGDILEAARRKVGIKPSGAAARPTNDNAAPGGLKAGANVAANVAAKIQQFFQAHGFTSQQARGVAAGAYAEGGLTGRSNPTSGAFGIGQWLGARKAALFKRYGPNPSIDQQIEFLFSEMVGGGEGAAGAAIRGQSTAAGALSAYINKNMRPGDGTSGDLQRGMAYLNSAPPLTSGAAANGNKDVSVSQTTNITVTGSDPQTTSKLVAGEQGRVNDALARNLKVAAS